jgi:ankyrin repeat protein
MKKQLPPPTELAHNFLSLREDLIHDYSFNIKSDLVKVVKLFNSLDDESKSYVINYKNVIGNTLLIDAANYFKEDLAITLIDLGFDINAYNSNGKSVLILAVQNKLYSLVDTLLNKGVDIEYAKLSGNRSGDKIGSTALMFAAEDGEYEIVKKLVERGADLNYRNDLGHFALLQCIKKTSEHLECFKYLIQQPGIMKDQTDLLGVGIMETCIKLGTFEFLKTIIINGAYNKHICDNLYDKISKAGGRGGSNPQTNTNEVMLEMLEFCPKFFAANELDKELNNKQNFPSKRMKI